MIDAVTRWAARQPDVVTLALVGSYAYARPRMASDVDLVLLTDAPGRHTRGLDWLLPADPRARLIRTRQWGPVTERRARLPSGLQVELGVAPPRWAALPLDPGTRAVLHHGCRILYDPDGLLHDALSAL